jgi:hypothetical protein
MNQYTTPKTEVTALTDRVDALNCDAIFIIKRIRGSKSLKDYDKFQGEYTETLINLESLVSTLAEHDKRATLTLRTARRRAEYALGYMRREYETRFKKLQAEAQESKSKSRPSSTTAALVAKFIINESLKLNTKYAPSETSLSRVSTVPPSAQTDSHKLAAFLTGDSDSLSSPDINISELDALEGMDSLT